MAPEEDPNEIEVLDGEVVEAPHLELEPSQAERLPVRSQQPAVQVAVAAATGFLAGAAAMALMRRYALSRLEPAAVAPALEPVRPGQARTYVVHVRRLG